MLVKGLRVPAKNCVCFSALNTAALERPAVRRCFFGMQFPPLWIPERALFTPAALDEEWGRQIFSRVQALGVPTETLPANRLPNLRGATERETYNRAKRTLAVANAPPSALKLQPIPPSADWQFHLAEGCPAHCQYCYLAGSLAGPPVVRVFANLPSLLDNLPSYAHARQGRHREGAASFEASCYTDPLALEHLTGSLAECIRFFGQQEKMALRFTSKFDAVDTLIGLPHNGRTRVRASVNANRVATRLEGGVSPVAARLDSVRRLALPTCEGGGGYPVGIVLAPIIPVDGWQDEYAQLLDNIHNAVGFAPDLTFECITHRFTPGSREVLQAWYPKTTLDMTDTNRAEKRGKFGGVKYVYAPPAMKELKAWFTRAITERFPQGRILYWT